MRLAFTFFFFAPSYTFLLPLGQLLCYRTNSLADAVHCVQILE